MTAPRKRVLLAEPTDAIRHAAETALRQNGFEVISVGSAESAQEVLQFSRPDVLIVGAAIQTHDGHPFYEMVQSHPQYSKFPLLIVEDDQRSEIPFPPEVVITQPIDPRELVQKAMTFSGSMNGHSHKSAANPLGAVSIDDEFLDTALGLDRIDVTGSEVLDRSTTSLNVPNVPVVPDHHLADHPRGEREEMSDSSRVESLMIREPGSEITGKRPPKAPAKSGSSGSSKLEIMTDQYGLSDPHALKPQQKNVAHDYDWFVNSMRDDDQGKEPRSRDDHKITVTDPSTQLEPHTKFTASETGAMPPTGQNSPRGSRSSAGVEKFIDEFKKEIELLRSTESEALPLDSDKSRDRRGGQPLAWEETVEKITYEQVDLFTRQVASELAEKLATKIAAKLDPDKLLQLIKDEVIARASRKVS